MASERGPPEEVEDHSARPPQRIPQRDWPVQEANGLEKLLNKLTSLGIVIGEPRLPPQRNPPVGGVEVGLLSRARWKRIQFAKLQRIYARDKAEALKFIIDQQNYVERTYPSQEVREQWKRYFQVNPELGQVPDGQVLADGQDHEALESFDGPITLAEMEAAFKNTSPSTARGLDGISLADLRAMNKDDILEIINGIFSWAPERIFRSKITLIPKKNDPTQFEDFRSICVMPLIIRILHRILAARLMIVKRYCFQAGLRMNEVHRRIFGCLRGC